MHAPSFVQCPRSYPSNNGGVRYGQVRSKRMEMYVGVSVECRTDITYMTSISPPNRIQVDHTKSIRICGRAYDRIPV